MADGLRPGVRAAQSVAALAAATAAGLARQTGLPSWRSVWAEDGAIFLTDAWTLPVDDTLLRPYSGYMLLPQRVLAELVALLPAGAAAWATALAASLTVAAVALFVFHASAWAYAHVAPRVVLAAAVVVLPAGAFESTANLANVHWYLLFGCFWALLAAIRTPGMLAARTLLAAAAPLANPLAALLAPLALLPRRGEARRLELLPRGAFALGLAAQGVAVLATETASPAGEFEARDLAPIAAVRVAGSFLVGDRYLVSLEQGLGLAFSLVAGVLVALLLAAAARRLDGRRLLLALLAGAAAAAFCVAPLVVRGTSTVWPGGDGDAALNGSRYFVLPILFLLALLLAGVDTRLDAPTPVFRSVVLPLGALWLASLALLNYSFDNPRGGGPAWEPELERARQACPAGGGTVEVPIAPAGWSATTPCRD